jgi:hypothetical protein
LIVFFLARNPFVNELPSDVVWRECDVLLAYFKSVTMDLSEHKDGFKSVRVVLLGDASVGKTSLAQTLAACAGSGVHAANEKVKLKDSLVRLTKSLMRGSGSKKAEENLIGEGVDVTRVKKDECSLSVWDLSNCHPTVVPFLLFPSSVFVLVFSLINSASLEGLHVWAEMLSSKLSSVGEFAIILRRVFFFLSDFFC